MNSNLAANTLRLGKSVKEYKRSHSSTIKVIVLSLIFGLIAVSLFAGVSAAYFFDDSFSTEDIVGMIALTALGALFALMPLAGGYSLWKERGASIILYEDGLIYRRGGKESVTTWDEIASYTQYHACRVEKRNGEEFQFGAKGFAEVAEKVRGETLQRMLPQAKAALLNGATLQFKSSTKIAWAWVIGQDALLGFTLDAHGITAVKAGKRIAWADVADVGIAEGYYAKSKEPFFAISDQNASLQMRYGILPNAHLLLVLCEEMVSTRQNISSGV